MNRRTDLAMEDHALWRRSAGRQTKLQGVKAREERECGVKITTVEILDETGARALGKPQGVYVTLECRPSREPERFALQAQLLARRIRAMLPERREVLVAGLGNAAVTPDAVGPEVLRNLVVTRHLKRTMPELFTPFSTVSALAPGVLGTTGVESAELLAAAVACVRPGAVIAVDAVAAMEPQRICAAVQLSTAGITPGSGVGNARAAINQTTLGVPVLAIGVPTVMDLSDCSIEEDMIPAGMVLIPKDIDEKIKLLARWVGFGIDLAVHEGLDTVTAESFLP